MVKLLSAQNEVENYKGSSYNLFLAFEPSCLTFIGNTEVINKHFSAIAKLGTCDTYTDDTQSYLRQSIGGGAGMAVYLNSVYRDSLFLASTLNIERVWIHDVVQDIIADSNTFKIDMGIGYQIHFKRGYIISAGIYYTYIKPINYNETSNSALNKEVSTVQQLFKPTLLIGWRF